MYFSKLDANALGNSFRKEIRYGIELNRTKGNPSLINYIFRFITKLRKLLVIVIVLKAGHHSKPYVRVEENLVYADIRWLH